MKGPHPQVKSWLFHRGSCVLASVLSLEIKLV